MKNFNLILFAVFFAVVGAFVSCDDTNESDVLGSKNKSIPDLKLPYNVSIKPISLNEIPEDAPIYYISSEKELYSLLNIKKEKSECVTNKEIDRGLSMALERMADPDYSPFPSYERTFTVSLLDSVNVFIKLSAYKSSTNSSVTTSLDGTNPSVKECSWTCVSSTCDYDTLIKKLYYSVIGNVYVKDVRHFFVYYDYNHNFIYEPYELVEVTYNAPHFLDRLRK